MLPAARLWAIWHKLSTGYYLGSQIYMGIRYVCMLLSLGAVARIWASAGLFCDSCPLYPSRNHTLRATLNYLVLYSDLLLSRKRPCRKTPPNMFKPHGVETLITGATLHGRLRAAGNDLINAFSQPH